MLASWQVVVLAMVVALGLAAAEDFEWKEPWIGPGAFSDDLGMLDRERQEYAENLAGYAINEIARTKSSEAALSQARRLIALSMHLMPRNKRALVANYQLARGIVPKPVEGGYGPEVLARLMFTRADLLKDQGGGENILLARLFIELAAEIDPKNEDAVYASELQRLDHGSFDWAKLTDVRRGAADEALQDRDEVP